ncbi:MAG: LysR family transcriptional regulator [Xanthomonadales bacterium]|nr:LysR family transcriptional regulator [Xanthomonadales bacterium]
MVVFCRVVEAGSFTAAGDALSLSKGAVSKAVSRLESALGIRLLHRTTRRQTLTEAGAAFHARAAQAIEALEEAARDVSEHADRPRGHLRISAPTFFGAEILSRHVGEFRRRFPEIMLEVVHSNRFVDLVAERFDAAIRISAPVDSTLVMRRLAEVPMVFCAAPAYLQRHGRPGSPAQLGDHECIIYTGSAKPREWTALDADGQPLTVAVNGGLHTNDDHTLRQAAIDGCGIVRMPRLFLRDAIAAGELEQIWPDNAAPTVTLAVVYPSRRELPGKVRAFVDFLVECRGQWE